MRDVVVLAEDAAEVASREENGAGAVVALYAWLFAKVRGDDVDFGCLGANEANACSFPAIDSAASRAQVAVAEVSVCPRLLT